MIADAPFGRIVLAVLTIGLLLYVVWRAISVLVIDDDDASAWGDRIGYTFSAVFYLTLAWTAGKAAITGLDPKDSTTVEDLSRSVMDATAGRWLVGVAGVVTMAVGVYFCIHKGIQRSFTDDLRGVHDDFSANEPKRKWLVVAGVVGWIGRGLVTVLVGFFVLRAAWRFDPEEARGFDQALRQVAGTGPGGAIVIGCGVGLIAYGLFCFASHRFRTLDDTDHG